MRPEDRRFIVPTWVRSLASFRHTAPHGKHWRAVDRILDAEGTRTMVLASDDAARTLHGWAVATGDALAYAYVPPELRLEGLARKVIAALLGSYPDRIAVTHAWPFATARFYLQPHPLRIAA